LKGPEAKLEKGERKRGLTFLRRDSSKRERVAYSLGKNCKLKASSSYSYEKTDVAEKQILSSLESCIARLGNVRYEIAYKIGLKVVTKDFLHAQTEEFVKKKYTLNRRSY